MPLQVESTKFHHSTGAFITYQGVGDDPTIFSGAKFIPNDAFSKNGELLTVNLFEHNFTSDDIGTMMTGGGVGDCQHNKTDVLFSDQMMTLARYPNIDDNTWKFVNIDNGTTDSDPTSLTILSSMQPDLVARIKSNKWGSESDPWIHSYTAFDWTDQ